MIIIKKVKTNVKLCLGIPSMILHQIQTQLPLIIEISQMITNIKTILFQ